MKSKKLVSMLLSLSLTAGCLSLPVFADVKTGETDAEYVVSDESSLAQAQTAYLDENGVEKTVDAISVVSSENYYGGNGESWYVVSGNVDLNGHMILAGDVNLILADGAELTCDLYFNDHASLSVYSQSLGNNMGKLTLPYVVNVSGDNSLNINGGHVTVSPDIDTLGIQMIGGASVTINAGKVSIEGATGIGAFDKSRVIINGGNVTVTGKVSDGVQDTGSSNLMVNGGTVSISGNEYGIYGGITVNGGSVTIEGINENAFSNDELYVCNGGSVVIKNKGEILQTYSYIDSDGILKSHSADPVKASDTRLGSSGKTTWYIVNDDFVISDSVVISGNVNLILADGKKLTVDPGTKDNYGIYVNPKASLNVYSQSTGATAGELTVISSLYYSIYTFGAMTVNGGNVTLTGIDYCIYITDSGSFTVNNGTVSVTGIAGLNNKGAFTVNDGVVDITGTGDDAVIYYSNYFVNGGNVTVHTGSEIPSEVFYIDENGDSSKAYAKTVTGSTTTLGADYRTTWYVVDDDVVINSDVNTRGVVNLILADGKSLSINGKLALEGSGFAVYGQSCDADKGKMTIDAANVGININNTCKMAINGGDVSIKGNNTGIDIMSGGSLMINSGNVEIRAAESRPAHGIVIREGEAVTLGYRTASDSILISGITVNDQSSGAIAVKSVNSFVAYDGDSATGIINSGAVSDLDTVSGVTLRPFFGSTVTGANVSLGDELGLNFYLLVPDDVVSSGAKVVMNGPKGEQSAVLSEQTKNGIEYKLIYRVNAVQADEVISLKLVSAGDEVLELYNSDGTLCEGNTKSLSVNGYLTAAMAYDGLSDADKARVRATYTYCAYSAKWKYGTDIPSNGYVNALSEPSLDDLNDYKVVKTGESSTVKVTGYALVLDSKTAIRLYFTLSDDAADHVIKCGDEVLTAVLSGDTVNGLPEYYVDIKGIGAGDLEKTYNVVFDESGERYQVALSAISYVRNVLRLKNTYTDICTPELCDLVTAVYAYAEIFK